jgi:hypothetical protein
MNREKYMGEEGNYFRGKAVSCGEGGLFSFNSDIIALIIDIDNKDQQSCSRSIFLIQFLPTFVPNTIINPGSGR